MKTKGFALAGGGALAIAGTALAGLTGAVVENVGDLGAGADSYRVYLTFDNGLDNLLAVGANAEISALVFESDTALVQNCVLTNSALCDAPKGLDLGGDSWVTIGAGAENGNDTSFSPNFLNGNGSESVIKGNFFSQPDNGGYFDANPGTPVLPDENDRILIAQFTLDTDATSSATYIGVASYVPGSADGFVSEAFAVTIIPTPGALALLGLAGLAGTRRRRG